MSDVIQLQNLKKYFPGIRAVDGNPVEFRSPQDSQALGITAIHQEAAMFPNLTVTENIFMGHLQRHRSGLVDWSGMRTRTKQLMDDLELRISPDWIVKELSIAQRHQIEIVKALSLDARVIIMDEPTSALSMREIEHLYQLVRRLRESGKAIMFISHKFDEIFAITDVYTVLRDGKHAGGGTVSETNTDELVRMMAGSVVKSLYPERTPSIGSVSMEVRNLTQNGVFNDVSFSVHAGEILGFFGLIGAGRSEVMQSIFGVRTPDSGEIRVGSTQLKKGNPRFAMNHGLAFVPEDRQLQGVILDMSIAENVSLPLLKRVTTFGFTRRRKELALAEQFAKRLSLRAASYDQAVEALSGGNQQKIVLSKWLATDPRVLILDEPTRGIDVGTKAAVHQLVGELADRGLAIVYVSSELHEVLGMATALINAAMPGVPIIVLVFVAIALGATLGAFNGALVAWGNVPPIIMTLGTMSVYRGMVFLISGGAWVSAHQMSPAFRQFPRLSFLGLPMLIWIGLITTVLVYILLNHTRWGRELYAVGDSEKSATYVGVHAKTTKFRSFVISGAIAGIAGLLWVSRYASAQNDTAIGFELQTVAAAVIGGVSIMGSSGTVLGVVLGALFLGIVQNALNVIGISPFRQLGIQGAVILIAIVANTVVDRRTQARLASQRV